MLEIHPDGVVIDVWVVPGASRSEIAGSHDGALRVRVAAPPEKGKANAAACELLSDALRGAAVELVTGAASRRKRLLVRALTTAEVEQELERLGIDFT